MVYFFESDYREFSNDGNLYCNRNVIDLVLGVRGFGFGFVNV